MSESFAGKVVIVTGAGRGIGRAIAESFAADGAKVVIAARTPSYGEEAVAAIRHAGGTASLFLLDVNDKALVENLIADTVKQYGALDIVVHAAADIPHGTVMDVSDEAIEKGIGSIIKASFWLTRAAVPHLRKARDGGRLIFISSICGPKTIVPGRVAYGVAKAGLEAFIRGAALEFARENITVNGIEPGLIASARVQAGMNQETLQGFASTFPVPRPGTSEEIAHVTKFLASKYSGYITGESIVIDGGSILTTSPGVSSILVDHGKK
jgi:3-oxoacyl-[acyl-carrier protein] reductase